MKDKDNERVIEILLVEDSEFDAELIREPFAGSSIPNKVIVVHDGEQALEYLFRRGVYKNASRPDLILLDINLPKKNGFEVLEEIKANPNIAGIPVLILTTSRSEQDILKANKLNANCFLSKPSNLADFKKLLKSVETFWFNVVKSFDEHANYKDSEELKILVVDDEPDIFELLQAFANESSEEYGKFVLKYVNNLSDAITLERSESFHAILLDLNLPDSRSLDTLLQFRDSVLYVPIIVLTGMVDDSLAIKALQNGASDFIFKTELSKLSFWRSVRFCVERAKLQRTIAEQHISLVDASRLSTLGEVSAGIAHEIRNPLAVICGRTAKLKELVTNAEAMDNKAELLHLVSQVENNAWRVDKIIKSLLFLSHDYESGNMEKVFLSQIIGGALDLCRESLEERSIKLSQDLPPQDLIVECRGSQIVQVLLNFLNNAMAAVEELDDKWIEIAVREEGEQLTLAVIDSGTGIPDHVKRKMFCPFYTTKEVGKGCGLGLSLAKGVADAHLGKIYLDESCPHTKFVLQIPKKQKDL